MRNRLRLLTAAFTVLYCSVAFSLGMGELELKSHLNQRFDAEIVLTGVGKLGTDEIIASLASQADFDRIAVDRDYQLIDLRFAVRVREDGQFIVHVTSSKPIVEPFLNFIVEAIWPNGRILREFTVLLDPPVFGTEGIEKIEPGVSAGASSSGDTTASAPQRRQVPAVPSVSTGRTEGVVTQDDEYGLTGPGDTLWTIAMKVRPNGNVSVQQTMLALQRANPEAFINNNINLLKAGHVLRIPDMEEIRAETPSSAIAEVKAQNEEFQDYRSSDVAQMDARRTSRREQSAAEENNDGELKLLAADRAGERSGADGTRAVELENDLAVAREDLDRARRANAEMNVRLDDLAGQVETLNEIVKLKDDQLAALRAELQKMQNASAGQPQPVTTAQPQQSASLLSNPMVLGGLGVLLIGGIAAALILLRKRRQEASGIEEDDFQPMLMAEDEPSLGADEGFDSAETVAEDEEDNDVTQQTSDVIGEAEIYIAYGRFPQAISFLQNAIENEPDRSDIQLKLLEVYVQTEDATAFNLQLQQLKNLGDEEATTRALELQAQIPGAAETAAAAMDATIVSSEPIQAIEEPQDDDDDDLSFDLDDLDAETEDDSLDLSAADDGDELSLDEAMELGDAELDLDLDAADDALVGDADDELDLDLDDGLDLDLEDDGLGDAGDGEIDLSGDDELDLGEDLDLTDELSLDEDDDKDPLDETVKLDDAELDATLELADADIDLGDDGEIELDLGDDDEIELDLGDDDDIELDLESDGELDLDDDGAIELDLDDDEDDVLDLGSDTSLELDDDGAIELDLDDDGLDLGDLEDDDLGELNLDEDASSKLDLARAYIEMGDREGAKSLLDEVLSEGDDGQVAEANELLARL